MAYWERQLSANQVVTDSLLSDPARPPSLTVVSPTITGATVVSPTFTGTLAPLASTGAALAVTTNSRNCVITTESLSTAAVTAVIYVVTNNTITATSNVIATVGFGTCTTGTPQVTKVAPGAGTVSVTIFNSAAATALNGTLLLQLLVM